jgi:hypothetical protein
MESGRSLQTLQGNALLASSKLKSKSGNKGTNRALWLNCKIKKENTSCL